MAHNVRRYVALVPSRGGACFCTRDALQGYDCYLFILALAKTVTPGGSPRGSGAGRTADHLTILFSQKILAVRSGNCIYRLVRCWLCYFLICWSCRGEGPGIYFLCFTISFYDQPLIVVIITFSRLSDYKIACYALLYKLAPNGQRYGSVAAV